MSKSYEKAGVTDRLFLIIASKLRKVSFIHGCEDHDYFI